MTKLIVIKKEQSFPSSIDRWMIDDDKHGTVGGMTGSGN
jgi:hypothetical protein